MAKSARHEQTPLPGECDCCGEQADELRSAKCEYCYAWCDSDTPPSSHPCPAEREERFLSEIRDTTDTFRDDPSDHWATHRRLVNEHGYRPHEVTAVQIFEDDEDLDYGLVVTRDRRVLEYDMDYRHGLARARLRLRDITEDWRDNAHAPYIKRALRH